MRISRQSIFDGFLWILFIAILSLVLNVILHLFFSKSYDFLEQVIDLIVLLFVVLPSFYIFSIQKKNIEVALKEAEAKYRALVEESLVGVSIIQDNKIIYVNPRFAEIFGYTQEEMLELDIMCLIAYEDRPFVMENVRRRITGEINTIRYLTRAVKKDNSIIYVEVHGSRMIYNGRPAVISTLLEITERKNAEKALSESEERFRSAFDNAAIGMTLVDANGIVLKVNGSFCMMVGYSEQELLERTFQEIIHPKDLDVNLENIRKLLTGEIHSFQIEERYIHKFGHIVWSLASVSLVRDGNGNPLYFITQIQDITRNKDTEELLRKSDKLSAVGQLAAGVAHEVRNPLTVLKGFVQLLLTKSNENKEYYYLMLSEVERIESIISEFLVLAKPQMAKFQKKDIRTIIQNVIALVNTKAIMNNVQILIEFEDDIPLIDCDENQLKQVFINILQNAVEAMPDGGEIVVKFKQNSDKVCISVIDQGCGISQERISKLGEPFYSNKEKGTGLGLMISYKIIENHQGRICVESIVGEGTTFDVILPILI